MPWGAARAASRAMAALGASLHPRHTVHPVRKVQRLEDDVGGAVAVRGLQRVANVPPVA